MTTRLERRYRALLRLLPRWYRAEREEEMVTSFLDGRPDDLDAEYGWPGWPETAATLALAVRTRMAGRVGDAVRVTGLYGLLLGIAMAAASLTAGAAEPLWLLAHAASAAALVAAVRGAVVETRLLAAVPVVVGVSPLAMSFGDAPWQPLLTAAFLLPGAATLLALCAAPPRPGNRWLWAGATAAAVGALLPLVGLDPLTCAPFVLVAVAFRGQAVAAGLSALALLPYAALAATLPGGTPLWPLVAFAAVAVVVCVRGLRPAAG